MDPGDNGIAYFSKPAADGRRGGSFYVNSHNLKSMTRDIVATITLHEASPGNKICTSNYRITCYTISSPLQSLF